MPNEQMNALIRRPRKGHLRLVSDGSGKAKLAPIAPEPADDTEASQRVVDGTADGGKGRGEGPQPSDMNRLLRDQTARSKGTITVDA